MKLNDGIELKGHLKVWSTNLTTREKTLVVDQENIVTTVGKGLALDLLSGVSSSYLTHFAWSDDNSAVSAASTTLVGEDGRKVLQSTSRSGAVTTFVGSLTAGEGNSPSTISRFGLFNSAAGGVLFNELVFTSITKNTQTELEFSYALTCT